MSETTASIVTWNVEWKPPRSRSSDILRERIFAHQPDIICLTETYANFLPAFGHTVEADPDYGYAIKEGRRKVLLWSRESWANVDQVGDDNMPTGRFAAARTLTPIGEIDVVGVCIPWEAAHVSSGRRDRQPWEDHLRFLSGLGKVLGSRTARTVIVGDYNQKIPKLRAPQLVFDALERAVLSRFSVATSGAIHPLNEFAIDHLAHSADITCHSVTGLSNFDEAGRRLSDHFGLGIKLGLGTSPN